jgi:hypothetical protein
MLCSWSCHHLTPDEFCGDIDKKHKEGLWALQQLLNRITERWPEVEFMSANNLGALIESE